MQDLIKAFTTYAGPDADAQRKQYQRMLDLTRSSANACTGLYAEQLKNRDLFIDLHLAELKALAYSNDRNGIKAKYQLFECATKQCRKIQCCSTQHRKNVMTAETALLESIHRLETESWLERLGYIVLLSIGIPLTGFASLVLALALGRVEPPDWLTQMIVDTLPPILTDPLRLVPVLVLSVILCLVALLLIRRVWLTLSGIPDRARYWSKARHNSQGASNQEIQP
ncbi:MAG: hypothetical protein OXG53_05075 [Chloroflexi bacterium]|nr:hypothetical protein [Chloroflexota bacterium]